VAEVELEAADAIGLSLPPWIGPEVSADPRYYNSSLSERPYRELGRIRLRRGSVLRRVLLL